MGRRRQAYKLEKRGNGMWYVVGTTPDGRRVHRSARTRSRKAAAQRLALIVEQEEAGARATLSEVTNTPLEELLAAWLTSAATEVSSAQGEGSLFETYARHFLRLFQTTARICDEVAIEQYKEYRLGQVQARTSFFTSPTEAAPTTAELIAQATEMIGCGREDSNLHECYLTRSLADLAEEKAHEFKGASRSGTPENTLGRPDFSPVVKNLARDLLRAVADGGDVPITHVHDLARAVIEAPAFQAARQILQGGSPEFAVRKALELASMVLTADDGAAENFAAETGVVALGAGKKTMRRSD